MEHHPMSAWPASQAGHFAASRLMPGMDVRLTLTEWARTQGVGAAVVVGGVGSLSRAHLRFAGNAQGAELAGPWEILSLTGTLGPDGVHLHIGLADSQGHCVGGHVLAGCVVATTLEVTLAVLPDVLFRRQHDPATGYAELQVSQAADPLR